MKVLHRKILSLKLFSVVRFSMETGKASQLETFPQHQHSKIKKKQGRKF